MRLATIFKHVTSCCAALLCLAATTISPITASAPQTVPASSFETPSADGQETHG